MNRTIGNHAASQYERAQHAMRLLAAGERSEPAGNVIDKTEPAKLAKDINPKDSLHRNQHDVP